MPRGAWQKPLSHVTLGSKSDLTSPARWRRKSWKTGTQICLPLSTHQHRVTDNNNACSVRLYKRGDEIADDARTRKLKREYTRTSQLTQHIFWTSVGREGAYHFEQELKHKKMAERLRESVAGGISVEKAQKMIRRSIDAQKKSNIAKSAASRSARSQSSRGPPRRVQYSSNRPRGRSGGTGRRHNESNRRQSSRRSAAPQRVRRPAPRDRGAAPEGNQPS